MILFITLQSFSNGTSFMSVVLINVLYIFTISETGVIKEKAKPLPEKKGVMYS